MMDLERLGEYIEQMKALNDVVGVDENACRLVVSQYQHDVLVALGGGNPLIGLDRLIDIAQRHDELMFKI